jgi:hypothetical protein
MMQAEDVCKIAKLIKPMLFVLVRVTLEVVKKE